MRIYLNGLGINNSCGLDSDQVYQAIFNDYKKSVDRFELISGKKTVVKNIQSVLPEIPIRLKKYDSRNNRLLLHAVLQIQSEVEKLIAMYGPERVAVVLGTSTSGISESESFFIKKKESKDLDSDFNYYKQEISSPSDFLAKYFELSGITYTISTACTSSAKTFIDGKRLIDAGLADAVIVGGVDTLSSLTLNGFDCLDSISPGITNPFSRNRDGINIGEGAAIFVISKNEADVELLGFGESSDAYHISAPDPEGAGAEIAIRQALKMAQLSPDQIGYINLHGTGTKKNDEMESKVIDRIFGPNVPVSSTKVFIGHTLGAAGAQEAALCYLALKSAGFSKKMPPHLWDEAQDPELPRLNFVKGTQNIGNPVCMSNSFAFGGNNVSLILGGK